MTTGRLRFLRRPKNCNYCHDVDGMVFADQPAVTPRILWVRCACGKKHYICSGCARRIGSVRSPQDGRRLVAACAKRYFWKNIRPRLAANGGKGA